LLEETMVAVDGTRTVCFLIQYLL